MMIPDDDYEYSTMYLTLNLYILHYGSEHAVRRHRS